MLNSKKSQPEKSLAGQIWLNPVGSDQKVFRLLPVFNGFDSGTFFALKNENEKLKKHDS
jgi:hypothetical protein